MPIAFDDLRADLEVYLVGRDPDEYLLYPRHDPERPMDQATVHRWLKKALRAGRAAGVDQDARAPALSGRQPVA